MPAERDDLLHQVDGVVAWWPAAPRAADGPTTTSSRRPPVDRASAHDGAQNVAATDLTLRLSQVEINVPLEAEVFEVEVPGRCATPLTLEELRCAEVGTAQRTHDRRATDCPPVWPRRIVQ